MMRALGVRARFVIVLVAFAAAAIAMVTLLCGLEADRTMARFGRADLAMTARQTAAVAGALYRRDGGWSDATVRDLEQLAAIEGHSLVLRDATGRTLPGSVRQQAPERSVAPVVVDGRAVGAISLAHVEGGFLRLASPESHRQPALSAEVDARMESAEMIIVAVGVAVALVLALLLGLTLVLPLRRVSHMAASLEAGDLDGVLECDDCGSKEHRQLASTLKGAAMALKREEALRRESVSAVAHELRTPLVGLRGRIEASQDGIMRDVPAALDAMHSDVLRLVRLIEDVEQLAQAQQPGMLIARVPVDLAEIANVRASALSPHFAAAGIALERRLSPVGVNGDPDRLGQIVDNLLSNALRYTDRSGTVLVRVRREGRDAVLEVTDTGIGIAEQDLPRIFDRFWRGDMSRSRATGGSGIGLALAQELVHGHDGEIAVRSTLGAGTTFRVTLAATRSLIREPGPGHLSLTHYPTPAGRPLVVASFDPQDSARDVSSVVGALRQCIATGQRVLIVQIDDWPQVWSADAIDALARIEGEARARGGAVVLLAESLDVRTRLLLAGAHHTIPVVASVEQAVETLADLGLLSPVDDAAAASAA